MTTCPLCRHREGAHDRDCPHYRSTPFWDRPVADLIGRGSGWFLRVIYPIAAASAALRYVTEPLGRWSLLWLAAAGFWTLESIKAWRNDQIPRRRP